MKTVAFIPVRGGSKSIPLKNIKLLCGKPLVCWSIEALENCDKIDEIIIATDSEKIKEVVNKYDYKKVKIYDRDAENACDTASTESVMLEYINKGYLNNDDIFMLVQATSPLTETKHFSEALDLYFTKGYDSILSVVRTYRFFWDENGNSLNYDYKHRPRRQDFNGIFVENGAFYINNVFNIKNYKNRLSGKIGIYEMPEYTEVEIDEPSDFIKIEEIIKKKGLNKIKPQIKLFVSDIDGTLTDGGMYYSDNNIELKKFNTRDGMAFKFLKDYGVKTALITSENTKINENRGNKLHIDYLIQNAFGETKLLALTHLIDTLNIDLSEVAYIGDDINCKEILNSVGYAACPNDAVNEIKNISGIHIMNKKGGEGCVREFVDEIIIKRLS